MRTICLILFLCLINYSFGQISGLVVDINRKPIPYANAILYNTTNEKIELGSITNEEGNFILNTDIFGTFTIRISLLSYKTWESKPFNITTLNFNKVLETIVLSEEVTTLEGVEIVAKRKLIQHTQEGSVINVQQSVLTKGSTVLQLLERSPGVIVDQRNNNFSLNGKSGTLIMINGKVQRIPMADVIAMLNGMNADNIEKIELLTNPSAKYDVDGNAGIINIELIKNETLGVQGNINISSGYGVGFKQNTGLSLNYGSERSSLLSSYTFSYNDTYDGFHGIGTTETPALGGNTAINFKNRRQQINRNHAFNIGYDYKLSEKTSFGTSLLYNLSKPLTYINNRGLYNFENAPFLEATINLYGNGNLKNYNASAFLEKKTENNTFNIAVDYINYKNKSPNNVSSSYFDESGADINPTNDIYNRGNRGFNKTEINVGVLKLDYKHKINDNATIESGLKGTLSNTINDARIEIKQGENFIPDERFISKIENKEKIGALYTIANYNFSKKLKTQLGMRYEYWNQNFDDSTLDRNFGKIFPSVFITKNFSDTTALNFAYNKRITRPNYSDLASFLIYNSPTSVFSGNPQLLPAITNNISLTYTNKSFRFSLLASNEKNPIARFQVTRNSQSDLAVIAPVNLEYQKNIDLQSNIPLRITNWWNINLNGTFGLRKFKLLHTNDKITHDYLHFNFNGNQTIRLNNTSSLELSGWYTSQHFNGSSKVKGFGVLNTGIKKEFKNGSSLQVSISDIFESFDINSQIGTLTREAFANVFSVEYSSESGFSRIFRISYSYPFGNKKVKSSNIKSGANLEKSRL